MPDDVTEWIRRNFGELPPRDADVEELQAYLTRNKRNWDNPKLDELKKFFTKLKSDWERVSEHNPVKFTPFLLVRAFPGDRGIRPIASPWPPLHWVSPDIWVFEGEPDSATAPIDHGLNMVIRSATHTLYAHVWNLGLAPIAGVRVEWRWRASPLTPLETGEGTTIGVARVDLGPRGYPGCHKLVKCPSPFRAPPGGWQIDLSVSVCAFGDTFDQTLLWDPGKERHVARRIMPMHIPL